MSESRVLVDDHGRKVRVGRTQDGEFYVSITDGLRSVMAVLSGERLAAFTGAVDCEAMPGQPVARCVASSCPQADCDADVTTASNGLPPKWCAGKCQPPAEQVRRCDDSEDPNHQCIVCFDYTAGDYRTTRLEASAT